MNWQAWIYVVITVCGALYTTAKYLYKRELIEFIIYTILSLLMFIDFYYGFLNH